MKPHIYFFAYVMMVASANGQATEPPQELRNGRQVAQEAFSLTQSRSNPEQLEKICFGYAKKGWEIIYTAQNRKMDEVAAKKLAYDYFPVRLVPEQQELISRVYSGEFKTPEEFATFLQNKCFADLPHHPERIKYSDFIAKSCYKKLVFPQYAYAKKYGEKLTEEAALQTLSGLNNPVTADLMKDVIRDMYASHDPDDNANVYWTVFKACVHQ